MYSEFQTAVQSYLEAELGYLYGATATGSVVLEDQPRTPDEFQTRLNEEGWGVLIGKPVVRKQGVFYQVLSPVMADENRAKNRGAGGASVLPDDLMLSVENILRGYAPEEFWFPIRLSGDVKQLFPEDGKSPWALIIETKTIPLALHSSVDEAGDILVFEDDSEITLV